MIAMKRETHHRGLLDRFAPEPVLQESADAVQRLHHRLATEHGKGLVRPTQNDQRTPNAHVEAGNVTNQGALEPASTPERRASPSARPQIASPEVLNKKMFAAASVSMADASTPTDS